MPLNGLVWLASPGGGRKGRKERKEWQKERQKREITCFTHSSCPCPKGPALLQCPSIDVRLRQNLLPVKTFWVCTFTEAKPWGSCMDGSSFTCVVLAPWEQKCAPLAQDIHYHRKTHSHCWDSKTALVVQIKQMERWLSAVLAACWGGDMASCSGAYTAALQMLLSLAVSYKLRVAVYHSLIAELWLLKPEKWG